MAMTFVVFALYGLFAAATAEVRQPGAATAVQTPRAP
jgi:hypothetical protein